MKIITTFTFYEGVLKESKGRKVFAGLQLLARLGVSSFNSDSIPVGLEGVIAVGQMWRMGLKEVKPLIKVSTSKGWSWDARL